jgi:heterodisulfide reductase subunit B
VKLSIEDRMKDILEEMNEAYGPRNKASYLMTKALQEYHILNRIYQGKGQGMEEEVTT